MKYLLLTFFALAMFFSGISQTTLPAAPAGDVFIFIPYSTSRVHESDSVQVQFTLVTNNAKTATISVTQASGPAVKFAPTTTWTTGAIPTTTFWLHDVDTGTYVFKAVGLSGSGTTGSQTATIQVVPDPVIPVCPAIPPPRTVTGFQITINNQAFTIPIVGAKFTFSDGTTQQ